MKEKNEVRWGRWMRKLTDRRLNDERLKDPFQDDLSIPALDEHWWDRERI